MKISRPILVTGDIIASIVLVPAFALMFSAGMSLVLYYAIKGYAYVFDVKEVSVSFGGGKDGTILQELILVNILAPVFILVGVLLAFWLRRKVVRYFSIYGK